MKIVITGGTGFVGSVLTDRLLQRNEDVVLISSSGKSRTDTGHARIVKADTTKPGAWQDEIASADCVINLTGRSVFHLWSDAYKKSIYSSRIDTTRNITDALSGNGEGVLLSASAAGYYGNSGDLERVEDSSAGDDFLADVCKAWEGAAFSAEKKGVRVCTMRFGVVLGSQGGAVKTMKMPFMLGLGGPIGSGRQYFPWIHVDDLVSAVLFLLDGSDLVGAFNFTAPETVRQKDFARLFAKIISRPAFLPAPSFFMKKALGEFGESLLQGQKVAPKALLSRGFIFRYPRLEEALQEILHG